MKTETDEMTLEERALLNEATMLGDGPERLFCGQPLAEASNSRYKYTLRMMTQLKGTGALGQEIVYAYAFILIQPLERLRVICRSLDAFEEALDAWVDTLPAQIPEAEITRLTEIFVLDRRKIEAAQFEVEPKPGEGRTKENPPGNS